MFPHPDPQAFSDLVNCFLSGLDLNGITNEFFNVNPIYNQFAFANYTLLMQTVHETCTTIDSLLAMFLCNLTVPSTFYDYQI